MELLKIKDAKKTPNFGEVLEFSSPAEYIETARKSPLESEDFIEPEFSYGKNKEANTRKKTYELIEQGRGLSSVRALSKEYRQEFESANLSNILNSVKSVKRKRVLNDNSGDLDLDQLMSGSPEFWSAIKRDGAQKIVTLGVNVSISAGNTSKDFSRLVALTATFAEILEGLGYGLEIYAVAVGKRMRGHKTPIWRGVKVALKNVSEPLDFERIYSAGLNGFLRDLKFRVEQLQWKTFGTQCYELPQDVINGMGLDVMVSNSWTEDGTKQVEKVVQAIQDIQTRN